MSNEIRNTSMESLLEIIRRNAAPPPHIVGALAKYGLLKCDDKYVIISTSWMLLPTRAATRNVQDYGDIVLIDEWIPHAELPSRLNRLSAGIDTVNDFYPIKSVLSFEAVRSEITRSNRHFHNPVVHANSSASGWPEHNYQLSFLAQEQYKLPYGLLAKRGLQPYDDSREAVHNWVWGDLRPWNSSFDVLYTGKLVLIRPNYKGRIGEARWNGDQIQLRIESLMDKFDLYLQAIFTLPFHERQFKEIHIKKNELNLDLPSGARAIELILLGDDDSMLSKIILRRAGEIFHADKLVSSGESTAEQEIQGGENQYVEFKSFIPVGDTVSQHDLIETVVAFANQGQGRIYVGVDNNGSPLGNQRALSSLKRNVDNPAKVIKDNIEAWIIEKIKPMPNFEIYTISYQEAPVIIVEISSKQGAVYSTHTNEIYIRKGSTDRIADPHLDLPQFYGDSNWPNQKR